MPLSALVQNVLRGCSSSWLSHKDRMLTPGRILVRGGQCGATHEIKTLELISVRTNRCRGLQAWMTDAKGVELFCKGIVVGGQYTGGGQEQPEQERPTNRTMLHHLSLFLDSNETTTTPQSIANNSNKTMMKIMTMIPDSAVWPLHFIPESVLFDFWLLVRG